MRGKREVSSELHLLFYPKDDGKKTVKCGNQMYLWSKTFVQNFQTNNWKLPL